MIFKTVTHGWMVFATKHIKNRCHGTMQETHAFMMAEILLPYAMR